MPNVDSNFPAEGPRSSGINEDKNNDEQFQVENESRKKRALRKSKEKPDNKEKPVRQRKKTTDETDKATEEKPKRFSHSTRQKRRRVHKVLFGEHNKRLAKKAPPSQTPQVNPSGLGNSSEFNWGQRSAQMEDTAVYFNYQTYMVRKPRARWSKQDTELFYEAVRQFGSDFSKIQQLFPGQEHSQILLKFKNEQQRHPARINDALTSSAGGHSYFKQVNERLKQMEAEEKQKDDDGIEEVIDLTGEEEAEGHKEEEPKSAHVEEKEVQEDTSTDFDGSRLAPVSDVEQHNETTEKSNEIVVRNPAIGNEVIMSSHLPSLPFVKTTLLWDTIESMDAFQNIPQKPHFRPLEHIKETSREGLAIRYMVTFSSVVEKSRKLEFEEPRSTIGEMLDTLCELESHGFDVEPVRGRLNELLSFKDKHESLAGLLSKSHSEMEKHKEDMAKIDEEVAELEKQLAMLEKKLSESASRKEAKNTHIASLRSRMDEISKESRNLHGDFKALTCKPIMTL